MDMLLQVMMEATHVRAELSRDQDTLNMPTLASNSVQEWIILDLTGCTKKRLGTYRGVTFARKDFFLQNKIFT